MKVFVLSEHLQKSLSLLTHAVSTRNQLPILNNILLETKEDKLILSATDLEIGIETSISANIEQEGGITVPAKLFMELINTISSERITLNANESQLEVTSKHTKSILQTQPKDDFPVLFEDKGEVILRAKKDDLQKVISRVVFAASVDTTRPSLSGVLLKKSESGFIFVATDGFRLSLQKDIPGDSQLDKPVLISGRVIREVLGFKQNTEVEIYLARKQNQIIFSQDDTVIVGRLIEAEFPNYEKIIPQTYSTKIFFDRELMLKAVKSCAIFARETGNIITLVFSKQEATVSSHAASLGENTVHVEARLEGEEKEIAFNARYLLDVLNNVDEEEMSLEMTGSLNPGVFKVPSDSSFLHLIMPIKT